MTQYPQPTIPTASAGPARVLIVDDDQTTCGFCAIALSRTGYEVVTATEAEQALAELRAGKPFDLLLVDIQMPGRNGLELARIARDLDPAMAVIIMTGHTTMDTLHQSARQGVANFLSKPFELEELRIAVDQALHKRQLMQESVRMRALEGLLASSEALNAELDQDTLRRLILARARQHVSSTAGFLASFGEDGAPGQIIADPPTFTLSEVGLVAAARAFAGGQPFALEGQPLCAEGSQTITRGVVVPLRAQGQVAGVLLLCDEGEQITRPATIDILALLANQAGTALRNAQLYGQLETDYHGLAELDRLKSEFMAIASHELRSPLAIVLGYTKMLRDRSDGDGREFAQRALDSAEQIKQIINNMGRLRDYDQNSADLILEECSLGELVRQVVERLADDARASGIRINLSLPEPAPLLRADREKVQLVVGNLLANAIKFTQNTGVVRVGTERWPHERLLAAVQLAAPNPTLRHLAAAQPADWAVVRVADTGIGIARDQQSRIFERFHQVSSSLTRNHGGAGLGLALVADLTRLQGGVVWVESEPGAGSRFSFALPIRPADE